MKSKLFSRSLYSRFNFSKMLRNRILKRVFSIKRRRRSYRYIHPSRTRARRIKRFHWFRYLKQFPAPVGRRIPLKKFRPRVKLSIIRRLRSWRGLRKFRSRTPYVI